MKEFDKYRQTIPGDDEDTRVTEVAIENSIEVCRFLKDLGIELTSHYASDGIVLIFPGIQIDMDNGGDHLIYIVDTVHCFGTIKKLLDFLGEVICPKNSL